MSRLTPTQRKIVAHLPATARELAIALYGFAGPAEIQCVYTHVSYLRRKLPIATRRANEWSHARLYFIPPGTGTPRGRI